MVGTMDTVRMMAASEDFSQVMLMSDVFERYKIARQRLNECATAQEKMNRFAVVKEAHEEVQRFGKYHPDYAKVSQEIRTVKRELDKDPIVIDFKQAEADLEACLNEVSAILAQAISPSIKVPTGNPFFDQRSCSGGCSTGKACGCG
ncbi:YlbF family regulator [Shouchella lonarensis]|uniref:Cell fate regulator YlbF, YheA/YmcA/DUF963 family (Controls sporulation, competence, biofilm development) n=1 Tax=Shouchella lonarensis TaxID=1464122 RepID=A0A1G6KTA8_9BACI|nr:YlbF family regulator [Shouchella lonarensis]SDC34332.1 Cell fate regulator YlbF, YheA/YmcA/DUF963 family (controls sporulation, competence, biofilm development) [Shouchella lonarensis]